MQVLEEDLVMQCPMAVHIMTWIVFKSQIMVKRRARKRKRHHL